MFIPVGDTPNPGIRPWATWFLIAVNVAVFLFYTLPLSYAQPNLADPMLAVYLRALGIDGPVPVPILLERVSAYDLAVFRWGFRPGAPEVVTLLTSMFLHANWLHLAGNMLFLWIYGDNVEGRLGPVRFLLAYLATGIASVLFFSLFSWGSAIPLIGASGAISGVLGFYFRWFPHNHIKVFVFFFPLVMTTLLVPARIVLGLYLILENLLPFLLNGGGGAGVAYGAHIGGFVAGLGLTFLGGGRRWR